MPGFFSSLRNRVQSVFMTPRQRARDTPLEHRTSAMWLERQVTVDSTSVGSNQASATRSGRVPTAGTSLRERSVRRDTTPGVDNSRPPNPIQFAGLRGSELVLRQALHRELDEAVRQGYVKNTFPSVRVGGPGLHSDRTLLEIVLRFSEGMRDLHARFPSLRGVEPPNLAQYDPNHDEKLRARRDPNYTPTLFRASTSHAGRRWRSPILPNFIRLRHPTTNLRPVKRASRVPWSTSMDITCPRFELCHGISGNRS